MSERKFIALGTASQVPTRERNHNGYFLRWDAEGFLFDPGEGTQRQMTFADVSASSITKIFITHFHGDHCLGLAGVLQRLSLDRAPHTVQIFYPASGRKYFENLKNASIYQNNARIEEIPLVKGGIVFEDERLTVEAQKLDHTVESWGFRFCEKDSFTMSPAKLQKLGIAGRDVGRLKKEGFLEIGGKVVKAADCGKLKKGQTFVFLMDTRLCENAFRLARRADLLVCESTYLDAESAEAKAHGHLTAGHAAQIADQAKANLLVLTHFSQRYRRMEDFVREARKIHQNTVAVNDGDTVDFPKRS